MIFLYTINLKCFMIFMIMNIYNQILIGNGYDDNDNDVLLLDISNNNNYIWTELFDPSDPPTQPAPSSTSSSAPSSHTSPPALQKPNKPNKNSVIIGAIIGCVCGGGLFIGTFVLYKRNKKKVIRIPPG